MGVIEDNSEEVGRVRKENDVIIFTFRKTGTEG